MADFIPTTDAELTVFARNFTATLVPLAIALGLTSAEVELVSDKTIDFDDVVQTHKDKQTAARAFTQTKELKKTELIEDLRSLARRVQASPATTDAMRADLGITIAASNQTRVGTPTSRPIINVNTSQRLQHQISFQDELTPTSRAKPSGVLGCEIRCFVGTTQPASADDYAFIAMDTATPYLHNFPEADGGKKAFYVARWANRAGQTGAWSVVASATIVA